MFASEIVSRHLLFNELMLRCVSTDLLSLKLLVINFLPLCSSRCLADDMLFLCSMEQFQVLLDVIKCVLAVRSGSFCKVVRFQINIFPDVLSQVYIIAEFLDIFHCSGVLILSITSFVFLSL